MYAKTWQTSTFWHHVLEHKMKWTNNNVTHKYKQLTETIHEANQKCYTL